jgi:hypothetical protein
LELSPLTVGAQWYLSGGGWTEGYLVPKQYRGHLPAGDPLHPFLQRHILPQLGVAPARVDFRVFSLKGSKVYLYEEKYSQTRLVGKFFVNCPYK